ncbi:hypothetical protein LUU34_00592500 [Aix galericulata]|nr:hypothetical protein LUU34_00592500 [Aix galericulata]
MEPPSHLGGMVLVTRGDQSACSMATSLGGSWRCRVTENNPLPLPMWLGWTPAPCRQPEQLLQLDEPAGRTLTRVWWAPQEQNPCVFVTLHGDSPAVLVGAARTGRVCPRHRGAQERQQRLSGACVIATPSSLNISLKYKGPPRKTWT